MVTRIFKESGLQEQFDRDGFVVLPLLNTEEVTKLTVFFHSLHQQAPSGFYSSVFSDNLEFKNSIKTFAEKIYASKVDSTFQGIRKLGASFLCKSPGAEGRMPVHQDWTVVDESKFCSITIWVPLVDTDESNGAIRVLRGSHKLTNTLRAPNVVSEYENVKDEIWNELETLPMKAGEAFVFNHALIHASSPNITSKERIAVAYGLIPLEAELFLYHKNENNKLEQYKMPDDMFLRYHNIGERATFGEKVGEFDYEEKQVNSLKLHHLLTKMRRERNMQPLFKDSAVLEFFEREGYAKIKVLDEKEIKELLDFYNSLDMKGEGEGYGITISLESKDKIFAERILSKIYEIALAKVASHFQNAKAHLASFIIKDANSKTIVPVHQDWSFIDEEDKYCSVTCWIPLVDVTFENGALGVIRGSHKFFTTYRPSPSPQSPVPLAEHIFTIFPYLKVVEMKAGEALVFDNRTFHGSPPNSSNHPRIAIGIGLTQKDAKLCHFYHKPGCTYKDKLLKYRIDPSFFRTYENATLSKMYDKGETIEGYPLEGEVPYAFPKFTADELIELVKEHGNEFNMHLGESLAKLFNYDINGTRKEDVPSQPVPVEFEKVEEIQAQQAAAEYVWIDDRSFFRKYTLGNILREMKKKILAE
ncbi:MAG: phytanoyl-CoA dioxygenase family protein [Chitinophagales bacterium]|nr:phytanoyl-CoA dioxygenase family protein [Chitinophagales bacterium]